MKYTTVKISEIRQHPTMRLDARYWIKKKKKINGHPEKIIEKIIENFKFKIPKDLPPISSIISGYFSYDIIRYIEKIPDRCSNDLKIPDVRLMRPKTIIIHDNLLKKIYFIINCFADEKINNYEKIVKASRVCKCNIVLKGSNTLISSPNGNIVLNKHE